MTPSPSRQNSFIGTYLRLLGAVKPHAKELTGAALCMVLLAATTGVYAYLVGPLLKFLVTRGTEGADEILALLPGVHVAGWDKTTLLYVLPGFILGVALLKGVSYFGQFFLMGLVGQKVVADLRYKMFEHITSLSPAFFHKTQTGQVLSRFTSDVYAVEQAVTYSVASYLRDTMEILVLTVLAFFLDWQLALLAFVVAPAAVFPIIHFGKRLKVVSKASQVSLGFIADRLQETIRGMRIIQVFCAEGYERGEFHKENQKYFQIMRRSFAVRALQSPVMEILGAAGLAGTIWYAGSRISFGTLDPGHFISFFATVMLLYNPVKSLGRIGDVTAAGVAAAERVFELLDEQSEVLDRPGAQPIHRFMKELVCDDVCFSYGRTEVLRGVTFSARRGEVVAIVGPSGAGKSTLVNLIPRFHDVWNGRILLDGRDVRDLTLESLRAQIGMVTQEVILFNDTVTANIAYGKDHREMNRIREAAERAHALDFIEALPNGFETRIGEGGIKLSGGQRQRIAIARALMKNAPLLILDEATSALDSESEREVQAALDALMQDRTTLVIAHRLSTIYRADRILVMDQGKIVEEGKHETLLAASGLYRRLYDLQFKDNGNEGS
jgi:ATP-binding cassette, subfamily B, bacterial MsbA